MTTQKLAYTLEEAAEATGYSVATLRRALNRNSLTARYANSKPVILAEELLEWLRSLPTEPNGEHRADVRAANMESQPVAAELPPAPVHSLPPNEWLTAEDLAAAWQLSPGTVANWRAQKRGPEYVHIGGTVRYHRDAVTAWLADLPSA